MVIRSIIACAALAAVSFVPQVHADAWTAYIPGGALPQFEAHSMVYDPIAHRALVVGSGSSVVWQLPLASPSWSQVAVTGGPPSPRREPAIAFYPEGNQMVLFSGETNASLNDTWILDLSSTPATWTQLSPGPNGRFLPATIYDPVRKRMIIHGGLNASILSDTWAFSFVTRTWSEITTGGSKPPGRWGHAAVYDPLGDRMIIFAGRDALDEVWALSLSGTPAWTQLDPGAGPGLRAHMAAAYDPAAKRMVIHGGAWPPNTRWNDLWTLNLAGGPVTWTQHNPTGDIPSVKSHRSAIYDPVAHHTVVMGGFPPETPTGRIWYLDMPPPLPVITGFSPPGGPVGTAVTINGFLLQNPTSVTFGGVAASFTPVSQFQISATVPAGAVTGRIDVVTTIGSAQSATDFFVGPGPFITSVTPDSGHVGDTVALQGANLSSTTEVRISGGPPASFTVVSDTRLDVVIGPGSTSGPIQVTTPFGSASSPPFLIVGPRTRPTLLSVRDVPMDQGGRVLVRWLPSDAEGAGVTRYRVWRRALLGTAQQPRMQAKQPNGSLTEGWFWESLGEVPARGLDGYAYTAETVVDSTALGNPYSAFAVEGFNPASESSFVFSNIDSGYSVDNLAPAAPIYFQALIGGDRVLLTWKPGPEPDIGVYQLYRSNVADFEPSAGTLIATIPDTTYEDHTSVSGPLYYRLAAVDVHGNVGAYASATALPPVSTLASLVESVVVQGVVRLTWFTSQNARVEVWRSQDESNWTLFSTMMSDARGFVRVADRPDAGRAGYRLMLDGAVLDEVWLTIPANELALLGMGPNPTSGTVTLTAVLPEGSSKIDLFDVRGRRVFSRTLTESGNQNIQINPGPLASGVYILRLSAGRQDITRRLFVVR